MKKRVLILTGESPDRLGGVEHFVRELVSGLQERGYSTELFHRQNSVPAWLRSARGRVRQQIALNLQGYLIGRNARKHMGSDVLAVISNSDVGWYAPPLARTQGKSIHIYHGTYRGQAEAIRPFIRHRGYLYLKWWNSMVLERFSGKGKLALANSEQTRGEVRLFFGFESTAVWLPIDTDRFSPGEITSSRAALNLPRQGPVGLFVGSTHPMKGFPLVQALIERLPDVYWVLALRGDAPEDLSGKRNATVLRNVSHDDLPTLYRAADFSVCPSLYEPFGYVVAEALACGTPVIATPGGASLAFLSEPPLSDLLIADSNNIEAFWAAVHKLLRNEPVYKCAVIEQARPRVLELMSEENWWNRFLDAVGM